MPCVVRRSKRSDAALAWELDLIEEVRRRGLGAPEIVATAASDRSRDGVVIQHRVPGARPASLEDWLAVAEYLTTLHTSLRSFGQRPGFVSSIDLVDVDAGGDVDLTEMPAHAVEEAAVSWQLEPEYARSRLAEIAS